MVLRIKRCLFISLLLLNGLNGNTQNFKVLHGIPHLPSFSNNTAIANPVTGMMIYNQTTSRPEIHTGAEWKDLTSANLTGATDESWFVVKNGIPRLPAFNGAKSSDQLVVPIGTIYYDTGLSSFQIWDGSSWQSFSAIQMLSLVAGKKFNTNIDADGFMIPFLSATPTGCEQGAIYLSTIQKKIMCYNGTSWQSILTPASPF